MTTLHEQINLGNKRAYMCTTCSAFTKIEIVEDIHYKEKSDTTIINGGQIIEFKRYCSKCNNNRMMSIYEPVVETVSKLNSIDGLSVEYVDILSNRVICMSYRDTSIIKKLTILHRNMVW